MNRPTMVEQGALFSVSSWKLTKAPSNAKAARWKAFSTKTYHRRECRQIHVDFGRLSQYRKAQFQSGGVPSLVREDSAFLTCSGGSMEKHRSRISICIILLVLLAAVGLAVAQEDTDRNLSKGPFRPALKAQNQAFTVPANDDCPGATVIPDGPYPVASAITADVPDATSGGDPGATCAPTEHGVWYAWTPAVTAFYQVTTCGAGTAGTHPDNRPDTVLQIISTSDNTCAGTIAAVACADDTGGSCDLTSTVTASFTGGVTYYLIAYH